MNCESFYESLSAYLDQETEPGETLEVETHLASCASCRDELESLKKVKTLVKTLEPVAVSPRLRQKVEAGIRTAKVRSLFVQFSRGVAAAAAVVVLFFASVTTIGYFSPDAFSTVESSTYLGNHAYHLMREPLANHASWSLLAEDNNFSLLGEE